MKLTLKQARRLEREIGTVLESKLNGGHEQFNVSIYEDVVAKVDAFQVETLAKLVEYQELTSIRFALRKAIETENEASGLNTLMNREAELKALLKPTEQLATAQLTDAALEIFVQRHAAAKLANEKGTVVQSRYGESTDELNLPVKLRTETVNRIVTMTKTIQRELREVVDKQAALNTSRTVNLGELDVQTLEAAGIVV